MTKLGLLLHPIETLFFRTGRPFGGGLPGESGLPTPQALAGAVRTFLLRKVGADLVAMRGKTSVREAFRAAGAPWLADVLIRGPWLAHLDGGKVNPYLRTPANIRFTRDSGRPFRLEPRKAPIPGWSPPLDGMCPLWQRQEGTDKEHWELISFEGLRAYLQGEELAPDHFVRLEDVVDWEERVGIGIDPSTYAARKAIIYTARNLRLHRGTVFYAEVALPKEKGSLFDKTFTMVWGGENRRVSVERVDPIGWPQGNGGDRKLLLLSSPAFFRERWRPQLPEGAGLRGAAVAGPFCVSGWDLARRGPKPTRFGVEAGSVYFVEGPCAETDSLCPSWEDSSAGYGIFLKGTWNYAN